MTVNICHQERGEMRNYTETDLARVWNENRIIEMDIELFALLNLWRHVICLSTTRGEGAIFLLFSQ